MRIDKVYIEEFKNLRKFDIDLNEKEMNTVLLGQNATGKSNFLEALVLIFKFLDLSKPGNREFPSFKYKINYQCRGNQVEVSYLENDYLFKVNSLELRYFTEFLSQEKKNVFLPKYVFTYYSGVSDRLDKIFWKHQNNFYIEIKKKDFDRSQLDNLRRLFYVKQIHSFFVLLAFFALEKSEKKTKDFLLNVLGIEDLESVLFVLKKPSWGPGKGDPRFWGAEGLVKEFLGVLWDFALAPINYSETVYPDFRSQGITQDTLYLFLPGKKELNDFSKAYFEKSKEAPSNTILFKALESTYISELLEEVKVRVKKTVDGKVTFKELSEGEQQLLTVIGLLIFTKEEESLVLLDEPDTHLNPIWKYEYLHYLKSLVLDNSEDKTQIILNTHDPVLIGSMLKEQVRIFEKVKDENGIVKTIAYEPDVNPRGLGISGILTSELFGLPTSVDKETQALLDERNKLIYKESQNKLSSKDENRLKNLFDILNQQGFTQTFKDPLYSDFIKAYEELLKEEKDSVTPKDSSSASAHSTAYNILKKIMEDKA